MIYIYSKYKTVAIKLKDHAIGKKLADAIIFGLLIKKSRKEYRLIYWELVDKELREDNREYITIDPRTIEWMIELKPYKLLRGKFKKMNN